MALLLTPLWPVPVLWYTALLGPHWALHRLRMWLEHVEAPTGASAYTPTWWERVVLVPWNIWLHPEHHDAPSIPCWALPQQRRVPVLRSMGGVLRVLAS